VFARMRTRIEAAIPFPWVGVKRVADAPRDRPGADVAVVDVPAIWPFRISAAGECGHARIEARSRRKVIPEFYGPALLNLGMARADKTNAGGFEGSVSNPTPSSDYIALGRRCAFGAV
jgi:hypothetical protein